MNKDNLVCPVKRINKSIVDIKVSKPDKESIEISIKGKDTITPTIEKYYNKFKKFIEGKQR